MHISLGTLGQKEGQICKRHQWPAAQPENVWDTKGFFFSFFIRYNPKGKQGTTQTAKCLKDAFINRDRETRISKNIERMYNYVKLSHRLNLTFALF